MPRNMGYASIGTDRSTNAFCCRTLTGKNVATVRDGDFGGTFGTRDRMRTMTFLLTTPRLCLREMSLDDLDFVAAMLADPEVMRYYPKIHTRDEAAAWVQRQMA